MQSEKFILSMLVNNESGVLTRVSGLFARRGFNIDSLSVGETENSNISRITITATGDDYTKDQIIKQLEKLHDVKTIELMDKARTVLRELLLIKVKAAKGERNEIMQGTAVFRAKVIDLSPESLTVEITGEHSKLDAFIEFLKPYGIIELCRTGV
ncbi:MAG TPA: acetolactate synthase small subunit, partial [Ruminococcaceae bacterium]|nr:acetolactate synthase small subunit [Oscillospiraceae bacterium]